MPSFITLVLYALAACLLYTSRVIYYQYAYWKKRRMLHLRLIPILGNNAPLFARSISFADHIASLYKEHPTARYYGMFEFTIPTVMIRDPELVRDICVRNFDDFVDHDTFVTEEMDPVVGRNLFSLKGQRWKDVRNTLTPSFTAARMKLLFELIAECSKDFATYFVEHPEVAREFEAKDAFTRYSNDVIGSAAFGVKVDSMKDRSNEFYLHGKAATSFSSVKRIIQFELMKSFPHLMRSAGATFLPGGTDRFFKNLVRDTIKMRKEKGVVRQDMLHLMMQAMDNGTVTMDDIVGQAFFFFLAGFDTSSSLMCFMCHELAVNPEIQDRLYREITDVLERDDGVVTYESLVSMRYLDMVISETLRKYPAAPFTNRICTNEHVFPPPADGYAEYRMERGTAIIIPIIALHRDPKYFPEPDKFDPERFNDVRKSDILPYTYLPFGLGPRQCIGYRFALMEAKIAMIDVMRRFRIKLTDTSRHPIVLDTKNFSMTASDGFWLRFEDREEAGVELRRKRSDR